MWSIAQSCLLAIGNENSNPKYSKEVYLLVVGLGSTIALELFQVFISLLGSASSGVYTKEYGVDGFKDYLLLLSSVDQHPFRCLSQPGGVGLLLVLWLFVQQCFFLTSTCWIACGSLVLCSAVVWFFFLHHMHSP